MNMMQQYSILDCSNLVQILQLHALEAKFCDYQVKHLDDSYHKQELEN
jgi:hypothetical protein